MTGPELSMHAPAKPEWLTSTRPTDGARASGLKLGRNAAQDSSMVSRSTAEAERLGIPGWKKVKPWGSGEGRRLVLTEVSIFVPSAERSWEDPYDVSRCALAVVVKLRDTDVMLTWGKGKGEGSKRHSW